jgi:bifunctional DNase/RNase
MLRMIIEGVGFDHQKQTVVVLKDWEGSKLLPIWIGPSEAKAIALELEGAKPSRPLSHDLLLQAIALAQGKVTRIVINDLQDATFYATIDIDTPDGIKHIDARPSDAIAVAVRAKCPVFVDGAVEESLIEMSDVVTATESSEDVSELETSAEEAAFLENALGLINSEENKDEPTENNDEIERFKRLIGDLGD